MLEVVASLEIIYGGETLSFMFSSLDNLMDFSGSMRDRGDSGKVSFGVYSSSGSLSFVDREDTFKELAELRLLKSETPISVTLKDIYSEKAMPIGEFLTDKWKYDVKKDTVSVTLKDNLLDWHNINIRGIAWVKNMTGNYIYDYLLGKTPAKYKMTARENLSNATKQILNSFKVDYGFLYGGTLWECWNKLCDACFLHIYKDNNGNTVCNYGFEKMAGNNL